MNRIIFDMLMLTDLLQTTHFWSQE